MPEGIDSEQTMTPLPDIEPLDQTEWDSLSQSKDLRIKDGITYATQLGAALQQMMQEGKPIKADWVQMLTTVRADSSVPPQIKRIALKLLYTQWRHGEMLREIAITPQVNDDLESSEDKQRYELDDLLY